jgi:hypothetical protein
MENGVSLVIWSIFLGWAGFQVYQLIYNIFLHPLKAFPGPLAAGASTWWKTYIEVFKQQSMTDVLFDLHAQYGTLWPSVITLFGLPR